MKKATIEQLAKMTNVKFRVTPKQSKMFQVEFFKQGGKWVDGTQEVAMINAKALVIGECNQLRHCGDFCFNTIHDAEEIEIIDTLSLQEQYEQDCKVHNRPWELWQYQKVIPGDWFSCTHPPLHMLSDIGCRRHPHADIMIEYFNADDEKKAAFQCFVNIANGHWEKCSNPNFHTHSQYRFDPEYKSSAQEPLEEAQEIYEDNDYDVFSDHAMLSQELRRVISWYDGCDVTKEAIEVTLSDIARIALSQDACIDDWRDIYHIAATMVKGLKREGNNE